MSEAERPRRRWWLRWPVLAVALLVGLVPLGIIVGRAAGYKSYHVPAESMEPALKKGDRFIGLMGAPKDLKRGDVILIAGPNGSTYAKRLAALPGDRFAMDQGVVMLNGTAIAQEYMGDGLSGEGSFRRKVRILSEQFPGEEKPHRIFDVEFVPNIDDFEEVIVRPGHIFLLGDNRDMSADSRVPREQMGLDQVPLSDVRGKALFHSLGSSRGFGEPL